MLRVANQKIRPDYSGLRSKFERQKVFGSSPTLYQSPRLVEQPKVPRGAPIPSKEQPQFKKVLKNINLSQEVSQQAGLMSQAQKHLLIKSQDVGKMKSANQSAADPLDFPKGYRSRLRTVTDTSFHQTPWNVKGHSTWGGHSRFHSVSQQTGLNQDSTYIQEGGSVRSNSNGSTKSRFHPHDPRSKLEEYLNKPKKKHLLRTARPAGGTVTGTGGGVNLPKQTSRNSLGLTLSVLEDMSAAGQHSHTSPALQQLLHTFGDTQALTGWKGHDEPTLTVSLVTNEGKQHTHRGLEKWVKHHLDFIPE